MSIIMSSTPLWLDGGYQSKTTNQMHSNRNGKEHVAIKEIHRVKNVTIRQKTKVTDALMHSHLSGCRLDKSHGTLSNQRNHATKRPGGGSGKRSVGRPMWADDIVQVVENYWIKVSRHRKLSYWRRW